MPRARALSGVPGRWSRKWWGVWVDDLVARTPVYAAGFAPVRPETLVRRGKRRRGSIRRRVFRSPVAADIAAILLSSRGCSGERRDQVYRVETSLGGRRRVSKEHGVDVVAPRSDEGRYGDLVLDPLTPPGGVGSQGARLCAKRTRMMLGLRMMSGPCPGSAKKCRQEGWQNAGSDGPAGFYWVACRADASGACRLRSAGRRRPVSPVPPRRCRVGPSSRCRPPPSRGSSPPPGRWETPRAPSQSCRSACPFSS